MTATSVQDPTAVMGRRIVAHLIDAVIYGAVTVGAFLALATETDAAANDTDFRLDATSDRLVVEVRDRIWFLEDADLWMVAAASVVVPLLLAVVIQGLRGWTIGKALTGIRTVNGEGEPPGVLRALLRWILWIIDGIPSYPLLPLVGGVTALASRGHRRIGDMAAGTYVVGRKFVGQTVNPDGAVAPYSEARSWEPAADVGGRTASGTTVMGAQPVTGDEPVADTSAAEPAAAAAGSGAYQPQWDPARRAYLQWDARRQTWLQFDDDAQEWRPIS